MKPVHIDTSLCSGCGLCVVVCPYKALNLEDGVARYVIDDCFCCGHCHAVCPEDAIVVGTLSFSAVEIVEECTAAASPLTKEQDLSTAALVSFMAARRSCRNYSERQVPVKVLEDLVQVGITAPSGTNCQPWQFIILPERSDLFHFGTLVGNYFRKLNRLAGNRVLRFVTRFFSGGGLAGYYEKHYHSVQEGLESWDNRGEDRLFHGAPAAILVTALKKASCPGEDAMLATQNILLAAHAMGLGTCLIGFAVEAVRRDGGIRKRLAIPESEEIYAVIVLGYPKVSFLRPAGRKKVQARILRFG
ncbi:nitroreductase family protein [Desulforhopalus sp. IMCC35007]|uniref:nitroreductase family protein n=1 Tax=Desulforhopalus sp. IMCC35007 TaxID=2569543 RepID=UPI0010ADEA14|nr:nitroreductase family protein [Desulforhopalus sp. IMCC35007]TKB05661.1 4Fe-4S dicluster domain-containing protein [Desulforhopalus sp. IMCC35007]